MSLPVMNAVLPLPTGSVGTNSPSVPAIAVSVSPVKPPSSPVAKPPPINHIPVLPVNLVQEEKPPSQVKEASPTLPKPTTNGVEESSKPPTAPVSEAIPPLPTLEITTPPAVLAETPTATIPVPPVEPTPEHSVADVPPATTEVAEPAAAVEPMEVDKPKEQKSQAPKRRRKSPAPAADASEDGATAEKKPRRARAPVSPYQSPLPEMTTVLNRSLKVRDNTQKPSDEKLIIFYKNEFLAVRNADGGFYLCQAYQNIYRSSHKVKIRWLSRDEKDTGKDGIYTRDFYDTTDFECILTSVNLQKQDRDKYKMKAAELERVENILKRAIDVEKGVVEKPAITEEHPDGIDLSLYRDESQLQKTKAAKRKRSPPKKPVSVKKPKKTKPSKPATAVEKPKPVKSKAIVKKTVVKKSPPAASTTPQKKSSRSDRSTAREKVAAKVVPEPVPSSSKIEKARNKIRATEAKKNQTALASKSVKAKAEKKEDKKKTKAVVSSGKKKVEARGKKGTASAAADTSPSQASSRPRRARK